jgi:aryl-alcohol dehydrogenase-like predicted oxidoreductase
MLTRKLADPEPMSWFVRSRQVQYSLIHRTPEEGVLQACNELGVKILAYSPLAQGILTGRYSSSNLPTGPRASIFKDRVEDITPLLQAIEKIGNNHGKTPAQVFLRCWACSCLLHTAASMPSEKDSRHAC